MTIKNETPKNNFNATIGNTVLPAVSLSEFDLFCHIVIELTLLKSAFRLM